MGALLIQLGFAGFLALLVAVVGLIKFSRKGPLGIDVVAPLLVGWLGCWVFQEEISGPNAGGPILLLACGALAAFYYDETGPDIPFVPESVRP